MKQSGFGPGFADARARLYRAEYALVNVAIVAYLVWLSLYMGGIDWLQVAFWAIFPDLASFIPIGASSKKREWPTWGADLYNFFHTVLVWGLVSVTVWVIFGSVYWPIFGWLVHMTTDRAVGYSLRARPTTP